MIHQDNNAGITLYDLSSGAPIGDDPEEREALPVIDARVTEQIVLVYTGHTNSQEHLDDFTGDVLTPLLNGGFEVSSYSEFPDGWLAFMHTSTHYRIDGGDYVDEIPDHLKGGCCGNERYNVGDLTVVREPLSLKDALELAWEEWDRKQGS